MNFCPNFLAPNWNLAAAGPPFLGSTNLYWLLDEGWQLGLRVSGVGRE